MKNLLRKFIAVLATGLVAGAAQADFLYSLVEDASYYYSSETIDFSYATVSAGSGSDYFYFYSPGETTSNTWKLYADPGNPGSSAGASMGLGAYAQIDTGYTSFLFELWDASGNQLAWKTYSRSEVQDHIFGTTSMGGSNPLRVGSNMVPEPTGGLLMLIGIATLALRRRKLA